MGRANLRSGTYVASTSVLEGDLAAARTQNHKLCPDLNEPTGGGRCGTSMTQSSLLPGVASSVRGSVDCLLQFARVFCRSWHAARHTLRLAAYIDE